jgi:hypothetical protein
MTDQKLNHEEVMSGKPSDAAKPDLDWSQVRETIFMLNLSVAQIIGSMTDGDENIEILSSNFIKMAGKIAEIQLYAERITSQDQGDLHSKSEIVRECQDMQQFIQGSVVMYQFYDRVRQRLDRVSEGLAEMTKLIGDPDQLYNPGCWKDLQETIHKSYSLEEERAILDHLKTGCSIHEAILKSRESKIKREKEEIELF